MHFNSFIEYLQFEKNYSPNTIIAYSKDIESFFDFASKEFGYSEIKNIHYSIIRNWIVKLVDDGVSNTTINRKISSLRTYYKFLIKIGDLEESPLIKHKALKTAKKIQVPFSENEIEDVLNLLNDEGGFLGTRNKLIVELFYSTGMRRGEMANLRLIDISFSQKTVKVLGKRNKERIVPLPPALVQLLVHYREVRDAESHRKAGVLIVTDKGDKLYEKFESKNIQLGNLIENPWGDASFHVVDPEGNRVAFFSPTISIEKFYKVKKS